MDPGEGRKVASVTRIKGEGHLVWTHDYCDMGILAYNPFSQIVQEAPGKLARALLDVLRGNAPPAESKL